MKTKTLTGRFRVPKGKHSPRPIDLASAWLLISSPFRPVPTSSAVRFTYGIASAPSGSLRLQANKVAGLHGDLRWLYKSLRAVGLRPEWEWLLLRSWSLRVVLFADLGDQPQRLGWMFDSPLLERVDAPAWVLGMARGGFITTEPHSQFQAGQVADLAALALNRDYWMGAHSWPGPVVDVVERSFRATPSARVAFPWFGGKLPAPSEYTAEIKIIFVK